MLLSSPKTGSSRYNFGFNYAAVPGSGVGPPSAAIGAGLGSKG